MSRYPCDHIKQTKEEKLASVKKWQEANSNKVREYKQKFKQKAKQSARDFVESIKQSSSCSCGENHIRCLEFHHRNPDDKQHLISKMVASGYSIKAIQSEIAKCEIICSNCHRIRHAQGVVPYDTPKWWYLYDVKRKSCCNNCGFNILECLDFHHVGKKVAAVTVMVRDTNYTLDDLINELSKCVVLCSNCHRKEHHRE